MHSGDPAAQARRLLEQGDIMPHFCRLDRRRDPGDAAADDQNRLAFRTSVDHLSLFTRCSSARAASAR